MLIGPDLLKKDVLRVPSRVFVCGPGYSSDEIEIREFSKEALLGVGDVKVVYGEEIEIQPAYKKKGRDLQTLEARFAHDVDFTLLILESPGSIAELGTFTQLPDVRDRLVVLVSNRFYRAESYIARGPLSLLAAHNPNSVIYYDKENKNDLKSRVIYHLTFYKYAHYVRKYSYQGSVMLSRYLEVGGYEKYILPLKLSYEMSIALVSAILADKPSYSDLLLISGLAPPQLNRALVSLYKQNKIEKIGSGRYRTVLGYSDSLLRVFSSTEISKLRARMIAGA